MKARLDRYLRRGSIAKAIPAASWVKKLKKKG